MRKRRVRQPNRRIFQSCNFPRSAKMVDLANLVEQLSSLTVIEAADLSKRLEEKWGVSAAAPVAVAAAGRGAAVAEAAAEKTEFNGVLTAAGEKKINAL